MFIQNCVSTKARDLTNLLMNMLVDMDVLSNAPKFEAYPGQNASGDVNAELQTYLQTYVQSRYAFSQIVCYSERSGIWAGFGMKAFQGTEHAALLDHLGTTEEAFIHLINKNGYVLTDDEQAPRLVLSNRISEDCVFFRTVPNSTIISRLTFLDSDFSMASTILPYWQISVTDSLGQMMTFGQEEHGIRASNSNAVLASCDIAMLQEGNGTYTIDKALYDVLCLPLEQTGVTVYFLAPNRKGEIVWSYLQKSLLLYGSILLSLGSIIAFGLTQYLYKPVQKTLQSLPQEALSTVVHEYSRINIAIQKLSQENQKYEQNLLSQNKQLKELFLQRLIIHNDILASQMESLIQAYDLHALFCDYCVVMAFLADVTNDSRGIDDQRTYEKLFAYLQTQSPSGLTLTGVQTTNCVLFMVSASPGEERLEALPQLFYDAVDTTTQSSISIYASAPHQSALDAHMAYLEAFRTAQYCMLSKQVTQIAQYSDEWFSITQTFSRKLMTLHQQSKVLQLIQEGMLERAETAFAELSSVISKSSQPYDYKVSQLVSFLVNAFCLNSEKAGNGNQPATSLIDDLLCTRYTPQELQEKAIDLFSYLLPASQQGYSHRFEEILRYMQTHFRENNLSAASVANDFHISVSSLSREFQRNKHTTFSDYLHCLRLQMAKSQLRQTQKTLRQIAETVGYTNEQTMTRAFKKYEGLTPGEYRTQVEKQ